MARRFVRHAMANRIFAESAPNEVRHTAASRLMITDPDFFDAVGLETSELASAAGHIVDAFRKYGDSDEQNETGFNMANNTDLGIYQFLAQHPDRARRFGAAMRYWTRDGGWNLKHVVAGFDWASIDYPGATVADMGGGVGSVSQALAKATQNIKFVVLDLPSTVQNGRTTLPKEFEGRINYVAHDFFTEQKVLEKVPDAYLFRWIFHNWGDKYCIKILQNLRPSLRNGTRIIIYEDVLSDEPAKNLTDKAGL